MKAGRAKTRVRIERPENTRTTGGGFTRTQVIVERAWADINPIQSREFQEADQVRTHVTHKIHIRWRRVTINEKDRLVAGERVFEIESAINVGERNRRFEILAMEIPRG